MFKRTSLVIIALLLTVSLAGADILYEWVDEKGVVTLKNTPAPGSKSLPFRDTSLPVSKKTREPKEVGPRHSYQPGPKHTDRSSATTPSQRTSTKKERFTGTVELYITDWCGYCKKAQRYLTDRGIPYVVYDIEKDSAANKRHQELGGRGVPLIIIGSKKITGFSPETLARYLNGSE